MQAQGQAREHWAGHKVVHTQTHIEALVSSRKQAPPACKSHSSSDTRSTCCLSVVLAANIYMPIQQREQITKVITQTSANWTVTVFYTHTLSWYLSTKREIVSHWFIIMDCKIERPLSRTESKSSAPMFVSLQSAVCALLLACVCLCF